MNRDGSLTCRGTGVPPVPRRPDEITKENGNEKPDRGVDEPEGDDYRGYGIAELNQYEDERRHHRRICDRFTD